MLILIGVFVAFLVVLGIIVKITESGEPPPRSPSRSLPSGLLEGVA